MKIPVGFKRALYAVHNDGEHINVVLVNQKPFIDRLVAHALRLRPRGMYIDHDDLYQEACIWIMQFMWDWDEDRETPLDVYVVYNLGVRLRNMVASEWAKKRNNGERPYPITNTYEENEDSIGIAEETINSHTPNPEQLLSLKEHVEDIKSSCPDIVNKLFDSLVEQGGNFTAACRDLQENGVKGNRYLSEVAFRQIIRIKFLPQLRSTFDSTRIIS